jgi:hypothetical protein
MPTQKNEAGSGFSQGRDTAGGQAAAPVHAKDGPWREYPAIDKALESDDPPVMPKIEKTCRELDRIAGAGNSRDAERAKAALVAYGRALDLFRRLTDLRDKAIAEAAAGPGRQNA